MTAQETSLSNFFETTLNGIVASGATSATLTAAPTSDGTSNIAAPYYLVIDPDSSSNREVVLVTAASGTTLSAITRDVEGRHTTDPTHVDGTTVRMSVIKEMFDDTHDRINDIALTGDVTGTLASATQDIATTIAAGAVDFAMIADTVDEDNMASDSATKLPTQQSVKAYADTKATTSNRLDEFANPTSGLDINDQEVSKAVLKDYAETDVAVTSGATLAIDLSAGNTGSVTLAHSVTDIDFTNVPTNGTSSFTLKVTQDGTGSRTMAINAITVNGGGDVTGLTPEAGGLTLSTGANDVDLVTFLFFDAGTPLINSLLNFS